MKRRVIVTLLLLISAGLLMSDMNFGVGLDFPGPHEWSPSEGSTSTSTTFNSKMGIEIFSEYFAPLFKASLINFEIGFGAAYLFPREIEIEVDMIGDPVAGNPTVSYIPLYLLGQISINAKNSMSIYGKARFGYDAFLASKDYAGGADLAGGLFLGLGGGVILTHNVFVELSYQKLHGSFEMDYYFDRGEYTMDVTQTNLSILIGLIMK